jgi:hypothetical protein
MNYTNSSSGPLVWPSNSAEHFEQTQALPRVKTARCSHRPKYRDLLTAILR